MNKTVWMKRAQELGICEFEIYEQKITSTAINVYQQTVDSFTISECDGICLRGLYNGKMGICSLEDTSDEGMEEALQQVMMNAMTITSDDEVSIQKGQDQYPKLIRKENSCIHEASEAKIAILMELEDTILNADDRIAQVMSTGYSELEVTRSIHNSKGLHVQDHDSYSCVVSQVLVQDGDDIKNHYDWKFLYQLEDLNIQEFASGLVKTAVDKLHATTIASGVYPVIIQNKAMASMLHALSDLFDGEDACKGVSILKDKLDTLIFSDCIQIIDDPFLEDGLNCSSFDDEGIACMKKTLVKDGVLQSYLHNTKSAAMMNTVSTGNGFKASYSSSVGIAPTNLYIKQGTLSFEELVKQMDHGVIITDLSGLHAGLNDITTDFSIQSEGFYVEHGKLVKPLSLITIAGNFMDMMSHVCAVGNDLKTNLSGVLCPSILFESLTISGE